MCSIDTPEPPPYAAARAGAATIRSRLVLEVASELVGTASWKAQQARVELRRQGAEEWERSLFGSDGLDGVAEVLEGRSDLAILNPATAIRRAAEVAGGSADDLAAIATIPSYDQLGLAVSTQYAVASVDELVAARPPLTLSLRGGRPHHAVHLVVGDVLAAAGASLADIESWGGEVRRDQGHVHGGVRQALIADGTVDAAFDEGIYNWAADVPSWGMRLLRVDGTTLRGLVAAGYRPGVVSAQRYPGLEEDVATIDFSGFLVYVRADAEDHVVSEVCRALAARANRIPWHGGPQLPLSTMCDDTVDAPLPIPLHPAAERAWRELGVLS
jgi:hypothetical protein